MNVKQAAELLKTYGGCIVVDHEGIIQLNSDSLIALLEQQTKIIIEQQTKNTEFANITDEYVKNGYKLADAVELVEIENNSLKAQLEQQEKYAEIGKSVSTLRPIEDLHEDHGDVLLWQLPICEAPDVGSCIDCNFDENLYTHWSPLPADLWETVAMDTKKGQDYLSLKQIMSDPENQPNQYCPQDSCMTVKELREELQQVQEENKKCQRCGSFLDVERLVIELKQIQDKERVLREALERILNLHRTPIEKSSKDGQNMRWDGKSYTYDNEGDIAREALKKDDENAK